MVVDGAAVALDRGRFDLLVHLARNVGRSCPAAELRAALARTLLYATAERIRDELLALRAALGRYGARLSVGADGSASFAGGEGAQ